MYGGTREVGEKYLGDRFVENMSCMYGIPNLLIQIKCSIPNGPWTIWLLINLALKGRYPYLNSNNKIL